ncbi:sigma factor, partial [Methylacidimicrobium cyclopophantes]|uniref:sigma factor n=1 Tax=Methylacidimicrobium cyclopophantes TaxID=1041766 RepID=UPI0011589DC4
PSRQRRVNAAEVVGLIARLRSRQDLPVQGVLDALDRLRLNIFWWNALREKAEEDASAAGVEWRKRRRALAAIAEPLLIGSMPIVHRLVCGQQKPEIRDAMQSDGVIGIYRALERFDPSRTGSFLQYAVYWVRNEIAAGALRSRVVSSSDYGQRRARRENRIGFADRGEEPTFSEPILLSLDTAGSAAGLEEEESTLHEVFTDSQGVAHPFEGKELKQEWLEILRDCPSPLRPFLLLRYYYPVWHVEGERTFRGAEALDALAPMARERLIAGASSGQDRVEGIAHS